jgi:hypothetical protein
VQFAKVRSGKASHSNILGGHRPSMPVNTTAGVHFKDGESYIIHSEGGAEFSPEDSILHQANVM